MSPGRCAKVAGVVVGISRPGEPVVRHLVPFFAGDFASFAADANARVGEETDLDVIVHVGMLPLIRALDSFADHKFARGSVDWVAHASRVSAMASRHRELFFYQTYMEKACFGETPKPTRETRALPGEIRGPSCVDLSVQAVAASF